MYDSYSTRNSRKLSVFCSLLNTVVEADEWSGDGVALSGMGVVLSFVTMP